MKLIVPTWSGKRGSNPRPSAWKADALPTELLPPRHKKKWAEMDSNHRRRAPADLQSAPFGHSGICPNLRSQSLQSRWRESNPRPADYKSAALTN